MITETKTNVDEIVAGLLRDAGTIDLHGDEARLFIQVLHQLAEGQPISSQDVTRIAASVGLTKDEADGVLNWLAERNDDGRIAGMAGLSQNDWPHNFQVNGRNMTTWCALDTLYLPQILKQTAEVKSLDPLTEEIVQVTIGPDRVEQYTPTSAVMSIIVPKVKEKGLESAEEIYMAFCSYSHFFTSIEAGQKWFEGKHVEPGFLSIEEGHELGRKWFARVLRYA